MRRIILFAFLAFAINSQAQLGGLMKKAEKAVKKETPAATPDDRKTQPKRKDAKTSAPKEDFPTQGVTSPTHQKYMGKVAFSASNIEFAKENEAAFITKANADSPIYFRVYMDNSQTNYLLKLMPNETEFTLTTGGMYKIFYYLDGVKCSEERVQESRFGSEEKKSFTTFRGALRPADSKDNPIGSLGYLRFYEAEVKKLISDKPAMLTPGDHKLKIEILPYHNNPETLGSVVASGEITITAKKVVLDPNDPKMCMPKAKLVDKAIEAKLAMAFKNFGEFGTDPKEVRILSQKWDIRRDEVTGRITRRSIEGLVATNINGKCSFRSYDFYQDWDGTGYQENSTYTDNYTNETEISCKCLKTK